MKRILLSLAILLLCFSGSAQRSLDLEIEILAPADGSMVEPMELFNLSAKVKNADQAAVLEAADSVYYYMIIYGDTMLFAPDNENHLEYTGNLLDPSEDFTISRLMAFSEDYENMDVELCIYIKPVNSADPLTDPDQSNNVDCVTITVASDDLSVNELLENDFPLSPNPANTWFEIPGMEAGSELKIFDLNGNTVSLDLNTDGTVNCSDWEKGIYLIRLTNSEGSFVKRLVVSH